MRNFIHPPASHNSAGKHVRENKLSVWENANMSEKKQTVDLGLLEEDDEFEEFPAEGKLLLVEAS